MVLTPLIGVFCGFGPLKRVFLWFWPKTRQKPLFLMVFSWFFDDFWPTIWARQGLGQKHTKNTPGNPHRAPVYRLPEVLVLESPLGFGHFRPNPGDFGDFGQKTCFWPRNQYYPSVRGLFQCIWHEITWFPGKIRNFDQNRVEIDPT